MSGGGPLAGVRVVELAGLGAAPYGCMMLADLGADVVRVERPGGDPDTPAASPLLRNRRIVTADLKDPQGVRAVLALVAHADVLVEAFRPGVAERLGVGPDTCLGGNPKLVYARMTGWGQQGPLAARAGHDLNYIGLAGVLHQIGPCGGTPVVPLNVIGDFGGGGLLMAFGIVSALLAARASGRGQVLDVAMVDGALSFMAMALGSRAAGQFADRTGADLLGGGAPYYNVYETADRRHVAVGPIEPAFYRRFVATMGLDAERWMPWGYPNLSPGIEDDWAQLKLELAEAFRTRPLAEWLARFEGVDACVTPVLTLEEAIAHPHHRARGAFVEVDGTVQQAPAPRFAGTPALAPRGAVHVDCASVAAEWGAAAKG